MERSDAPGTPSSGLKSTAPSEPAAVRVEGHPIVDPRADDDAATEARARFRRAGLPALSPDARIAPLLLPYERVVAIHPSALLERRQPTPRAQASGGVTGTLYVTSRRLVLVGRVTLSFGLGAIDEVLLAGDRLLLVLREGHGLMLEVQQPRLLRVEVAAARASLQSEQPVRVPQPAAR